MSSGHFFDGSLTPRFACRLSVWLRRSYQTAYTPHHYALDMSLTAAPDHVPANVLDTLLPERVRGVAPVATSRPSRVQVWRCARRRQCSPLRFDPDDI